MHTNKIKPFVIITPIYEDFEAAKMLFNQLSIEFGNDIYIIAIDDGSIINPIHISILEQAGLQGSLIKLKYNLGHQKAIAVGLSYVAENLDNINNVVVMDSDGEDSPSSVKELIEVLNSSDSDIVVARRRKRNDKIQFRMFYAIYKLIFWAFVGRKIYFGNFIALKLIAVKRLVSMQELWLNFAACVLISRLRINSCTLDRGQRYSGFSRMNFISLTLHGFRALMVFAEDVLVRVGILCSIVAALSVFGGILAIVLKVIGFATPGWFSVAFGVLLLVFLQTGALTLMTLMLTGVIKSGSITSVSYKDFIDEVQHAHQKTKI